MRTVVQSPTRPARSGLRVVAGVFLALILLAVIGYFAIGAYIALKLTTPDKTVYPPGVHPDQLGLRYEDVTLRTRDGLTLAAWALPAAGSDRAVVLVHGRNGSRHGEFSGRFVEFGARLQAAGYNVLLLDLRGHGDSQDAHFTLGAKERWDVLSAVDWLRGRGASKIAVLGVSLGAGAAVLAAADPEGGQAIRALILDSPYGDVPEVLALHFPYQSGLPGWFLPGALLAGRVLLGVDFYALRPVDDLRRMTIPLLILVGAQEDVVPLSQFEAIKAARPDAETWLVPDTGHTDSRGSAYAKHPEEYTGRVVDFLSRALR